MKQTQMSESMRVSAVLAIVGGFFDAYTYLCRGGVFANAQTGNIVLFSLSLAEKKWGNMLIYLIPITAFALGVLLSEIIRYFYETHPNRFHWRQIVVISEIILAGIVAFIPQNYNALANTIISFICALQVEAFRKVRGSAVATTMCTGNLRSATELICKFFRLHDKDSLIKAAQYMVIILYFIIGAALGVFFVNIYAEKSILLCCILMMIVFFIMFQGHTSSKNV